MTRRPAFALSLVAALAACVGLPAGVERTPTYALSGTADTTLGQALAPFLAAHPGENGFYLLEQGADAFLARLALARAAQRTLDLQYYIFRPDDTGAALLGAALAAADRGVRVRLLLDDMAAPGWGGALAALDAHPNLEIRLFNPFAHRGARWLDFVTDFARVNRRMHNKSMTADSQLSIVGGRNVGDEYFAARPDLDFSDLDVLAAGPVVREVAGAFDAYWNSDAAWPLAAFGAAADPLELARLRGRFSEHGREQSASAYARVLRDTDLANAIRTGSLPAYWGRASVIADSPAKVTAPPEDRSTHAILKLGKLLQGANRELILVSPYFVPGKEGVQWLRQMAARGVRVRVLTNSFAATDVRVVHAGYAAYRRELLESGIELYELKPTAAVAKRTLHGSSRASLHAKAYMTDRRALFVGSLNLDPRSVELNTEMGVVLESEPLCRSLAERFDQRILDLAWRLQLDGDRLVWATRDARTDQEPEMGLLQGMVQGLLRLLPLEEQL